LAADESLGTIEKRFSKWGIENTAENRKRWREIIFGAYNMEKYISGVILFDETVWTKNENGEYLHERLLEKGVLVGVKVDEGKEPFGKGGKEYLTKGLARLEERVSKYKGIGATFAKWRAVSVIGDGLPSEEAVSENAKNMAKYAKICQEGGIVPIVEPETLMEGDHDILRSEDVTMRSLVSVFSELERERVDLGGLLLKVNFVVWGKEGEKREEQEVACKTLRVLRKCVPEEVPGVLFLSGGLSSREATEYLNEINKMGPFPWQLSFSFGRALQGEALEAWGGREDCVEEARAAFVKRASLVSLARFGEYKEELEDWKEK
jgi:fructose-bisphosphate aldolase class I